MADRYIPREAAAAMAEASRLRMQYREAVSVIRKDTTTTQAQKRRELGALRDRYLPAMAAQRSRYNAAYEAEQRAAIATMLRPGNGRQLKDSFHHHRRALRDASLAELTAEFDWGEVCQDTVLMQVVGSLAFQRIADGPPGDVARRLFERFINQRLSNGSFLYPDAAGAYARWLDLRLTTEEHMAATATFSTSDRPEPTTDPTPVDPNQAAADRAAVLLGGDGTRNGDG
jgi:hypothetical protein